MVGVFTRATGNLDLVSVIPLWCPRAPCALVWPVQYDAGTAVQLKHNVDDGGLAAALAGEFLCFMLFL